MDRLYPAWTVRLRSARWVWVPLLVFSLTRLGILLVAYFSAPILADSTVPPYHLRPDNVLLDAFGSRWDAGFYLEIADQGYRTSGDKFLTVAFFPLYPLLIRAVGFVVRDSLAAGLLIANLALLGASMLFYRLVSEQGGPALADRSLFYLLIFPASFFGSALYSESLLLLFSIGALYLARKGYWASAAVLGVLAALTRLVGVLVAPMLLVEWWVQRRTPPVETRPPRLAFLAGLAVPLGTLAYMLYLYEAFGDALAFVHVSAAWERVLSSPLAMMGELFSRPLWGWKTAIFIGALPLDNWVDLLFSLGFLAMGVVLLVKKRWSEGVFVLLGVLIPLSSGLLMSQRRYMWVLFPAFSLLGSWGENPWVDRAILVFFLLGLALFTALFANWYWVG